MPPRSPQTLSIEDRRVVAVWAADCAEHVLPLYETAVPGDDRVRSAIEQTRAFASGTLDVREAIRTRGAQAGSAAREASTPAAKAAAYAAEQAAAVAHMGAHALGAAGYAGKAWALSGSLDADADVVEWVTGQQLAIMDAAAASVLVHLPLLGEDAAGPLGPGRLTSRWIGETITAIQAVLRERQQNDG